jgi:hypothetical protein
MKRNVRLLSATLVIALAPIANAQTAGEVDTQVNTLDATAASRGQSQVAQRIADDFASLAGGRRNALALVEALRNGTPVTSRRASTPRARDGNRHRYDRNRRHGRDRNEMRPEQVRPEQARPERVRPVRVLARAQRRRAPLSRRPRAT